MNLHTNKENFQNAILATAQMFGIREVYVEKDYWVTVALHELFHSDLANQVVFKGGTALSKCYKLIDRFSEDIDLVVLRNAGESDNQLKNKIKTIGKVVANVLPEIEVNGLTHKMGNIRKTVHPYEKLFRENPGQVREHIILESTWLGNSEPSIEIEISSYVYEMMMLREQQAQIGKYKLAPFTVQVLSKERTFCEKIMSMVRFSRSNDPITDLRNKIRHVYDIHQMLKDNDTRAFFENPEFNKMLVNVGQDDMISFKNNNEWIPEHPATALIFAEPEETWKQVSPAYRGAFQDLVFGEFPSEKELVDTLKLVAKRLEQIEWNLG